MLKLNLGCGPHAMNGWVNYDLEPNGNPKVQQLDLSRGVLPHDSNTVDFIFSEHFIEHITKEQGLKLLGECYRVLKPNGIIRISTPDLYELIDAYFDFDSYPVSLPGTWEPASACDMVNEGMRLWGHQYLYSYSELKNSLELSSFKIIVLRKYHQSFHDELRGLEIRPQFMEMYVEAEKA